MAELHVELVAADHLVWSGDAVIVSAQTVSGSIGIQAGHTPVLGELTSNTVVIRQESGEAVVAAVHGGFLSFADNKLSLLAETAELAKDIDKARAERALERARTSHDAAAERRAELRLKASMALLSK
ncbi:ATP synthase F1 subunit epsilon [Mangrovactinospora gilvigrisea]|uniref:ATP synthase epsilon chain n=1 Tax=Mangrovactinospora gilvigrisea TaxID=1428644 RepID=A0A1J7BDR0_9ACTN|nr:F0F1 ATP synthase subunit epsilon [Mangrovactinospora gilvigrisea]OIV36811.1 ATP synthase F1 subunit epsilon [Mangrovactinospora gilvigrisea]